MKTNGLRTVNGINAIAMDGFWESLESVPASDRISEALLYAGCEFYDEKYKFVSSHVIALAGIGGIPVARQGQTDSEIASNLEAIVESTKETMGSAAAFSYLNTGEKKLTDLYDNVTKLGHFSVAHVVQANFLIAGITQGTELELSLQRDLFHISKVTNTRTRIQNNPPIVVRDPAHLSETSKIYEQVRQATENLSKDNSLDELEIINGLFPINKASLLMISGDLGNLRKFCSFKDDKGKEMELREVAKGLNRQLGLLWPEIFKGE